MSATSDKDDRRQAWLLEALIIAAAVVLAIFTLFQNNDIRSMSPEDRITAHPE
jgi:hypothetical protein